MEEQMVMQAHNTTPQLGCRLGEAADFLINLLAGKELPFAEVLRLAHGFGVSRQTLARAKRIVGAKSRRRNNRWYMSVPEEMRGRTFNVPDESYSLKQIPSRLISSDWVSVVPEAGNSPKTDIPPCGSSGGGLRVKVGEYAFEADEHFPTDKLAEILRGLAVSGK